MHRPFPSKVKHSPTSTVPRIPKSPLESPHFSSPHPQHPRSRSRGKRCSDSDHVPGPDSSFAHFPRRRKSSPTSNESDDGDQTSVCSRRMQKLQVTDENSKPTKRKRHHDDPPEDNPNPKQSCFPEAPHPYPPFPAALTAPNESLRTTKLESEQRPRSEKIKTEPKSTSIPSDDSSEPDTSMLLQPDTRPITPEQLVNEVKGIYSGLVMVEKKCVEIITELAATGGKLSNDQSQALIALHRTLLHEHHDFFLASQHPTASPALRRLATKYAMPARMWRNGIHAFLELLRQQLPDSHDHMLAFVYIAYSMMSLLMESVPSFQETWIECLGDLARYRMAIEEVDLRDREIWSNVARMWYNKAADRSPNVGRIQHHLAVLARPTIVLQLCLYCKALVSVIPFPNARESIMLLFGPFLDPEKAPAQCQKYSPVESSLVTASGIAFTRGAISHYVHHAEKFLTGLDGHMSRTTNHWKTQGVEVASSLIAANSDFGGHENYLWELQQSHAETIKTLEKEADIQASKEAIASRDLSPIKKKPHFEYWTTINNNPSQNHPRVPARGKYNEDSLFDSSDQVTSYSILSWLRATSLVAAMIGNRNTVPYIHITLAFIWGLSFTPGALIYIESYVPWSRLVMYLNTLRHSGVEDSEVEAERFPKGPTGVGPQLPEDFSIRGLAFASYYYPSGFFSKDVVDEEDRQLELPSQTAPRAQRCLWLGVRIASLGRYMTYNVETKQFSTTEYASSLSAAAELFTFDLNTETARMIEDPEFDAVMVNA